MLRRLYLASPLLLIATAASAQGFSLDQVLPPGNGSISGRMIQLIALMTVLSIAPGLLVMVTSFTRFVVALSFLRSGLGLQSAPSNIVLLSLSLFMTFYVMGPTFDRAWQDGVRPLTENKITEEEAFAKVTAPFRDFMLAHVRPKDLDTFAEIAAANRPNAPEGGRTDLRVLIPAFMISELRRGFEIGFLIALPFLVIDMVVAVLVMSMGMMMMPPHGDLITVQDPVFYPYRRMEHVDHWTCEIIFLKSMYQVQLLIIFLREDAKNRTGVDISLGDDHFVVIAEPKIDAG